MPRAIELAATSCLAIVLGWWLRGLGEDPPMPPNVSAPDHWTAKRSTVVIEPPTVSVSLPIRANAPPEVATKTLPEATTLETSYEATVPAPPAPMNPARLQTIRYGSEIERYDGLMQAVTGDVPDEMLKSMFETDASDRVRLVAFEAYVEARVHDDRELRTALAAARYVPNAAIQQAAAQQLDELDERDRIHAANAQGPVP